MTDSLKTVEFDISGQICPSTLLVALREVNRNIADLKSGQCQLLFRTDNRDCTNTIPEAVGNMGLKANIEKISGAYTILIAKA
jgi:TusA-related sulfurtransferase